jgi:hypothetical protein
MCQFGKKVDQLFTRLCFEKGGYFQKLNIVEIGHSNFEG